ncbi:MAG: hypothetical protein HOC74_39465 [Gemmatimonadetes bacterium]|jgi:hypothetical protein|nr:hypothetical protein [Gemmatimonadota bacterium]
MGWILELFFGLCVLTLCGGITVWIMRDGPQKFFRNSRGPARYEETLDEVKVRLDEIERRMTDVQDVMIALSEKFDRWEREKASF